ncbi:PREDICTED: serine/threonine-protein phosphatase 4 regulatory subunit 4-like [Amphimedon queenslandica]|uniref:Phosphatase 2A Regulatory Subunit A helical domain-containing protein n=1 Tax=Amphimedon queenslandica TaxID=400682 RepID=A0A1X7V497_AMPQE|nr:PREDICTED: serine/threonine-protein phosphatase 4 regulatory subunit 4-like [Amphimedon queenslandica]|eukprot:XP_019850804.1 PREDICTED: serine/threonine-protein phosphatase 4 regulatory subunit 4-like [Amphimedon queenslandica]
MDWSAADILLLGADVDEFRLEKNIKPEKSLDEIEKLCVDEKLSVFEKACLLVESSYDVQKMWVIEQLPSLLVANKQGVIDKIVPKLLESFHSSINIELHRTGSKIFSLVAKDNIVDPSVFVSSFLPAVLSHFENKNQSIGSYWFDTLVNIIPYLPKDTLKHKIMNIARLRGQLSQPVPSRQTCCKIIAKMAGSLEANWVKQELLSLVKALAQDVDNDVRETMCGELACFAKCMGRDSCGMFILPEVIELSRDEEVGVRCAAMVTITELLPSLDENSLEKTVVPLVMELLEESETGKEMRLRIKSSEIIGHLAHELKGYLTTDQSFQMLKLFEKLSQTSSLVSTDSKILSPHTEGQITSSSTSMASRNSFSPHITNDDGAECRRLCAYNMPALMLFADRLKDTNRLITILKSMISDKHEKVRRTIASGFHEVVSILGDRSNKITKEFATLLNDDNIEVLSAIVDHIPDIIEVLAVAHNLDSKTRQPGIPELIQPLLHFEQLASSCRQWRLHSNLLDSLSCLTRCMTSDQLYSKFVPIYWKCISRNGVSVHDMTTPTTYVLPVKLAALRTLCSYIKYIRKLEQRREICSQFILDCAHHESHKQRLLFIYVCQIILENFSRQFFKEQGFYSALLDLSKDPSSNVRLKLCSLLSQLKTIILLPTDREKQQAFESTISTLLMDKDAETIAAVSCAVKEMAKINYRIQSMIPHSLLEEDLIDKEREDEEQQLLKDEEQERERDKDAIATKLSADFRRSNRGGGAGGQSPGMGRSLASKKLSGSSAKKSSPSVTRKGSGLGLNSTTSGSCSLTNSPNPARQGGKASSASAGTTKKRKGSIESTDSNDKGKGFLSTGSSKQRTSATGGSSPSLCPSPGSSSPTVNRAKSREILSSSPPSTTSKSSPASGSKKSQLSHATKATRGSSYN